MKIMWLSPECPYPANTGGRIGIWKRIVYLSDYNEIFLYAIDDDQADENIISEIKKKCADVKLYKRSSTLSTIFRSTFLPYPAVSRWNSKLKETLKNDFELLNPDLVIVDFPQMIGVLPVNILNNGIVVLNQHNIEYQALESLATGFNNPLKKLIYNIVAKQMRNYEKKVYGRGQVSLYTFVSLVDKEFFEKEYNLFNTYHVPVGAEIVKSKIEAECHNLIFVANMSYPANEEGAIWLSEHIMPLLRDSVKDIKLYLVGKNPTQQLKKYGEKYTDIVVTGTVDDLDEYYTKTNVVVVPIMTGGGVNVKLLEALGKGKIVVTTPKGIEGTDFINGQELLVGNDETEFADLCIKALTKPDEYLMMLDRLYETMSEKYSWKGIMKQFNEELRDTIYEEKK